MKSLFKRDFFKQAFKYAIVGAMNTVVTFIVYILLTEVFDVSKSISNLTGYIAGLINSFVWNKQWTFKQSGAWIGSAIRFLILFAVCYLMQKFLFDYLCATAGIKHVYSFVIAMLLYNVLFFLANKYIIFKEYGK